MAPIFLILCFLVQLYPTLAKHPADNNNIATLLSTFPSCAIPCLIVTQEFTVSNLSPSLPQLTLIPTPIQPCPPHNLTCECSSSFRAATAACEILNCSPHDYTNGQAYRAETCSHIYRTGIYNATSISSAIASATAAALAAVSTADAKNPLTYPPCAQNCLSEALQFDCGAFNNTQCVCQNKDFLARLGVCENTTCNPKDLSAALALAEVYCNAPGVGGIGDAQAQLTALNETLGRPGDTLEDLLKLNRTLQMPRNVTFRETGTVSCSTLVYPTTTEHYGPYQTPTKFHHGSESYHRSYTLVG